MTTTTSTTTDHRVLASLLRRPSMLPASPSVPSGIASLDAIIGGLPVGLAALAGLPGHGKSALALSIAYAAATRGARVAYFSLETHPIDHLDRLISSVSGIPGSRLRGVGVSLTSDEEARRDEAIEEIRRAALGLCFFGFTSTVRGIVEAATEAGAGLVVIDSFLNLDRPFLDRDREHEAIARELADAARSLGVPILVTFPMRLDGAPVQAPDRHPARWSCDLPPVPHPLGLGLGPRDPAGRSRVPEHLGVVLVLRCPHGAAVGVAGPVGRVRCLGRARRHATPPGRCVMTGVPEAIVLLLLLLVFALLVCLALFGPGSNEDADAILAWHRRLEELRGTSVYRAAPSPRSRPGPRQREVSALDVLAALLPDVAPSSPEGRRALGVIRAYGEWQHARGLDDDGLGHGRPTPLAIGLRR